MGVSASYLRTSNGLCNRVDATLPNWYLSSFSLGSLSLETLASAYPVVRLSLEIQPPESLLP